MSSPETHRWTRRDAESFAAGRHFRLYERLGAHPAGEGGYTFGVWAPNAASVSVIGEWNGWDPAADPLTATPWGGVWEGRAAEARRGQRYKLHVVSAVEDFRVDKADPFAFATEMPPGTASVLAELPGEGASWGDEEWLERRAAAQAPDAPVTVYEAHPGSWRRVAEEGHRSLGYREIAPQLADHLLATGFTHVELLPAMEHPFFGSWGYQTTGYFAPTARYGSPEDFRRLVDELHRRGLGVWLDWVPGHFPGDEHGLVYFDGTHLFEHADPRQGRHPEWDTYIFNFGRPEVRSFLISSACFWMDRFHVDGLRVDAVASMLYLDYSREDGAWVANAQGGRENLEAVELLRDLNREVYSHFPGVHTIAEDSTSWPGVTHPVDEGGLGFGYKWDLGFMNDSLRYMARDPIHRRWHHRELTFRSLYAFDERYVLPYSHDEVVYGKGSLLAKMPGDDWQRRANLRLLLAHQWCQPGKKLLFMGQEMGQPGEWDHDAQLDWGLLDRHEHGGIRNLVEDLNRLYREVPALHRGDHARGGFEWLEADDDEHSVLAFLRWPTTAEEPDRSGTPLLAVCNFTPVVRGDYLVGVPCDGHWREVLNTDAETYGGSGQGNMGGVAATPTLETVHGQGWTLSLTLPPLGVVWLVPEGGGGS